MTVSKEAVVWASGQGEIQEVVQILARQRAHETGIRNVNLHECSSLKALFGAS